jgi:prohibitin 1
MKHVIYFLFVIFALSFNSCAIVSPGQVGVVQKLGKLGNKVHDPGPVWYNPFLSKVVRANVQTSNLELSMSLPSKEGLSVNSQISILYAIKKNKVPTLIQELSLDYEPIIANVFRSAASDVCSKYFAKDMHSGMRANIETAIKERMTEILTKDGLIIEAVLMKSIQLPPGLAQSIEQKLQAEQDAMRMEFVLQEARAEADRRIIEAQGVSDSQKILSEGLSDEIIKVRSIEAFEKLSRSPNAKIIITDGKTPLLINQ